MRTRTVRLGVAALVSVALSNIAITDARDGAKIQTPKPGGRPQEICDVIRDHGSDGVVKNVLLILFEC